MGIDRFIHSKSHRFSLPKISAIQESAQACDMQPFSAEKKKELDAIFSQTFTFFAKCNYTYLFLSEDHKYIIKFLKRDAFDPKSWLAYIPVSFNPYHQDYNQKCEEKSKIFLAFKMAFNEFKEETSLVYMHIDTITQLHRRLAIVDREGKRYKVDVDKTNFYIEKRAQLLCPKIADLMRNKEEERAKQLITSVFAHVNFLVRRGFFDPELTLCKNLGVIEDKVVQLAIGKLYPVTNGCTQLTQGLNSLRSWLERNYPELLSHFDEEYKRVSAK